MRGLTIFLISIEMNNVKLDSKHVYDKKNEVLVIVLQCGEQTAVTSPMQSQLIPRQIDVIISMNAGARV